MHQCLSCNQPCSPISAFCDTCRASLLAKREQTLPEEQPEMVKAGGGNEGESSYAGWEMSPGMADADGFSQHEASLVGSQTEQNYLSASVPEGEQAAWSFETSGIYTMETLNDAIGGEPEESRGAVAQATHVLATPPRPRKAMPRNVKRALIVFCIVGTLALLTDGILLALSLTRHHATASVSNGQPGIEAQQEGISPNTGGVILTPTDTTPASAPLALSPQHLTFSAVSGQNTLPPQTIAFATNTQGFSWQIAQLSALPSWLRFPVAQGTVPAGASASFAVIARPAGLAPGLYTAAVQVKALDAQQHVLANSPASFGVTLNVRPPCVLSVAPTKLSFTSVLVSEPAPQTLTLSVSAGCTFPVSWQVSSDASWLTFSRSSGTETAAGGTIIVQASTASQLIGSYTAHITFQGTDGTGAPLVISPATLSATLTVIA